MQSFFFLQFPFYLFTKYLIFFFIINKRELLIYFMGKKKKKIKRIKFHYTINLIKKKIKK